MENYTEDDITTKTTALITHDVQSAVIEALQFKAFEIRLESWQDEENYKLAKSTRSEINNLFKKLDRRRIDIKKAIEDSAQSVLKQIKEPITYLDSQMAIRDEELELQRLEAEAAIQKVITERSQALQAQGVDTSLWLLHPDACSEDTFQDKLGKAIEDKKRADLEKIEQEKERVRLEAEQKAKDLELEKLRAENEKLKASHADKFPLERIAVGAEAINTLPLTREEKTRHNYPSDSDKVRRIIELEDELNDLQITSSTYISGDLF